MTRGKALVLGAVAIGLVVLVARASKARAAGAQSALDASGLDAFGASLLDGLVGGDVGTGPQFHKCSEDPSCTVAFAGLGDPVDGPITSPAQI